MNVMKCSVCLTLLASPGGGPWDVVECKKCGHRIGGIAFRAQSESEGDYYFNGVDYVRFRAENARAFEQLANQRVSEIERLGLLKAGASIFEVGCSTGEVLSVLKQRNYKAFGHDAAQQAIEYARERRDVEAYWDMDDVPKHPVDAVFAFHVIEHVRDPIEFVNSITANLSPMGLLYLRMPHIGSAVSKVFGKNWPGYSLEHIQFFTRQSVTALLARTGFTLQHFGTHSHARFLAGALLRLKNGGSRPDGGAGEGGNSTPSARALNLAKAASWMYEPAAMIERLTLMGDELVVIARKS
jgi:2-polyprenyl-3-methyl-5-hydroxy-6-metoxy-1,4-benzoquinol methylase